ncbi:LOW QUALITY PROTEIN: hypothetical protein RJ641_019042 [Dillenia turbinata]|uniref:Protein EXECUTER 1, chloroplastic n=1 Tax=Dillenia turbinata TaxID=194707 RepID=A0AAN8URK5_9MAGN
MATVSSSPTLSSPPTFTDSNPHKLTLKNSNIPNPNFLSLKRSTRVFDSALCRCNNNHSSESSSPSDNSFVLLPLQRAFNNVSKQLEQFVNSYFDQSKNKDCSSVDRDRRENAVDEEDWDWGRWKKHFKEIDEQERVVSILKSQLGHSVNREDYEDAARLKVAIAAAAKNDTVGRVMSELNRAIEEECYNDAAFIRDNAAAGLVGWWAGISEDGDDPYGQIIRISPEHGRYVARSYSPRQGLLLTPKKAYRQLATAASGVPLFEVFLTANKKAGYKVQESYALQAVYLMRRGLPENLSALSSKFPGALSGMNSLFSAEGKSGLLSTSIEETDDGKDRDGDSDVNEGLPGLQNIFPDMIPGVKVKVLKVTAPGKADHDVISKVIDKIMDVEEEEEEENDIELDGDVEDENKYGSDQEQDEIEMDAGGGLLDTRESGEIAVKVIFGGIVQKFSSSEETSDLVRVPASLRKKGRFSFSFSIEDKQPDSDGMKHASRDKKASRQGQRTVDQLVYDLSKSIGRDRVPLQVLKNVGEIIIVILSQAQSRQPLSGSMTFNRIQVPASPDPLDGLYIGSHGLYTSEVIQLRRRFGQWHEDKGTTRTSNLEFYEYGGLTGDPYVPAGQVAFRAKVGKHYQLPHKGIIPEELGVIARYRGQGRLAEPGFRNPCWVDGELIILDGKYIKGGPVVGFVYWEYQFLVFFNRLRLQE